MVSAATGSGDALYLYAIAPRSACANIRGNLGDSVHLVQGEAFAAIVRPTAEVSFAGRDRQDLARLLLAHQQVVEGIMAQMPVLPVKFATVAPDRASVERCLASGEAEFAKTFVRLAGKTQFEILVTWGLDQVFAQIARSPEVIRLKQEMARPVELGAAVKGLFDERRGEVAEGLSAALRAIATDVVDNALMDDRMVLNLALLIDAAKAGALDDCLEELDAAHDGMLNFRCVGPLPPYSFGTVEASFLDAGQLSWARGVLELGEDLDVAAVRNAYRRLARKLHPDVAGEAADQGGMTNLHNAYQTLCAFAEANGPVHVSVSRQELRTEGSVL